MFQLAEEDLDPSNLVANLTEDKLIGMMGKSVCIYLLWKNI